MITDELYDELLERAGEGNEIIVIHDRSVDARKYGQTPVSGGGSIYETGVGSAGLLGRRADLIYMPLKIHRRLVAKDGSPLSTRDNEWFQHALLCRLRPKGRIILYAE